MKRGDVYKVDLNPTQGSEQAGIRPCVIVQNDIGNQYSSTTIIVPLSKNLSRVLPVHVPVPRKDKLEDSMALCEQIKVIDKDRIKDYLTSLNGDLMKDIEYAIKISLDLE